MDSLDTTAATAVMVYLLECHAGEIVNVAMLSDFVTAECVATYSSFSGISLPPSENIVAFFASLTDDLNLEDGRTFLFDNVHTNIGGYYFPIHGIFVCPDDAFYFFSWRVMTLPEYEREAEARLMMGENEVKTGPKSAVPLIGYSASTSTQAIVQCEPEKAVYVQAVVKGGTYQSFRYTFTNFAGFRIG